MRIYDIDQKIEAIMEAVMQGATEGVDTETGEVFRLSDYLEELQMSREQKIKNLALYCKNTSSDIDELKKEMDNFKKRIEQKKKRLESAMEYLRQVTDGKKVEDTQFVISYRKSTSVEVLDEGLIPAEYFVEQAPKLDKISIRDAIKAGKEVAGAALVEKQNMTIK